MDYQKLLIAHLELIDRVVRYVARRHHLSAADTEEFSSLVRYKLVDRDFAVLRKFQGRSNLATYLTTVIERLYLDFCIGRWGKWRPSASARRLGSVAVRLEQLMLRDGLSFDEAVGTLQTNHAVSASREELHALMLLLPTRAVRRLGGEEELAVVAARGGALDPAFDRPADQQTADRIEGALARAIDLLAPQDQLILKLRYLDDLAVAAVARVLQMEPKPLYRRLEHIFRFLRDELQHEGIDHLDIDRVVGHPALTLGRVLQSLSGRAAENDSTCPSKG